ncbi:MAG: response regulator transcription factor [Dehalococcoidales bacterium]|nr:response regulator transcription factor [Dehalococcoidales bacterium]
MEPIRVHVVDDHSLFRRGVIAVISTQPEMKVVGEAANGREAVEAAKQVHPDVVLMDLSMPEMGGVEATRYLLKEIPETNILMLTMSDKEEDLFNAIKAGAKGYLLKEANSEELVRAITHVAGGGVIISPTMAPKLLSEIGTETNPAEPDISVLSPRELEILQLVAEELTDKEIAKRLFISLNTVKTHLKNILAKLHLKSRTQVAAYKDSLHPRQKG